MDTLHTIDDLVPWHGCTFVPTMGALHAGHCALIRQGVSSGHPVMVSIFVNPSQFAPHEDFGSYPRPLGADIAAARAAGAAAVFVPTMETIYPTDDPPVTPPLPNVATAPGLEDQWRPDFFAGVCQVVARLFDLVRPSHAVFGEKDWQQLQVLTAMVQADTSRFPLQIISGKTVRDADGLALSSRNAYLRGDQRCKALALHRALQIAQSVPDVQDAQQAMLAELAAAALDVHYAVIRSAATLETPNDPHGPCRALIAASVDSIRLIDNGPV